MKFAFFTNTTLRQRRLFLLGVATLFPVSIALLLTLLVPAERAGHSLPLMQVLAHGRSQQLEYIFDKMDYSWPPQQVPEMAISRLPGDLAKLEAGRRKALFLRTLLPLVLAENWRLRNERRWLEGVMAHQGQHGKSVYQHLQHLAWEYGLEAQADKPEGLMAKLYDRVDELPVGLVLAQAANESGWGTSRFSREANNLFGEWTYKAEEGLLPRRRAKGARHYVRRFADLYGSVRSYMNTINRGQVYAPLRKLRARMRREGRDLDSLLLANGLKRYSERGKAYVAAIQSLIRSNRLDALNQSVLASRFLRAPFRQPKQERQLAGSG